MRATDMSGTPNNGVGKNTPASWELRLGAIETKLDSGLPFPDENGFDGSVWWMWEERIKEGHHEEVKLIKKIYNPTKDHPYASSSLLDPNDIASENYWDIREVSDSMYAALVVAMWSRMEYFLKSLASICIESSSERIKLLKEVQTFCQDSLMGKKPDVILNVCIKNLNKLKQPYNFKDLEDKFKEPKIKLKNLKNYTEINSLHILNNLYKHTSGYYNINEQSDYNKIHNDILLKWNIKKEEKKEREENTAFSNCQV
jgi:hypothetical protein